MIGHGTGIEREAEKVRAKLEGMGLEIATLRMACRFVTEDATSLDAAKNLCASALAKGGAD